MDNSAITLLLASGATFLLLLGGCAFVMRTLHGLASNPQRGPRLISMLFPDLFPVEEPEPAQRVLCTSHPGNRLGSAKRTLEDQGYEVWTAKDTRDGVYLLHQLPFAALVAESEHIDQQELTSIHDIQPGLPVLAPSGEFVSPIVTDNNQQKL